MVELTEEQVNALDAERKPLHILNPRTKEVFVLVRLDVYDLTCNIVGGQKGKIWDDEADEGLIRKPS
jgi:hypothetical protein